MRFEFMREMEDLIKDIKIENLESGNIVYTEKLDFGDENNNQKNMENYWYWKYYDGSITKKEHDDLKERDILKKNASLDSELPQLIMIYDYIFEENTVNVDSDISTDILSELWIMRPRDNFSHEDKFKKLIYDVYVKKEDSRFREIALEYYKSDDYNIKYGIDEQKMTNQSSKVSDEPEKRDSRNDDWISQLFRNGENNG